MLADLRESGSIEQDADLVMFLYRRDDVEDRGDDEDDESLKMAKDKEKGYSEIVLSIAKNRQGKLDYIDFHFYGAFSSFREQKEKKPIILKKKRRSARMKKLND